jgi:hypothetical protein
MIIDGCVWVVGSPALFTFHAELGISHSVLELVIYSDYFTSNWASFIIGSVVSCTNVVCVLGGLRSVTPTMQGILLII